MEDFALSRQDMKTLRHMGHERRDYKQINECANKCVYTDERGHTISYKDAIDILGRFEFLSGISRAAFHWTSYRVVDGNGVYFDCSNYFRD